VVIEMSALTLDVGRALFGAEVAVAGARSANQMPDDHQDERAITTRAPRRLGELTDAVYCNNFQ
jgi:hypothetical protein